MRVLIFHGYLLHGTGSNVYNARLAEALLAAGHEVHLVCQERAPERLGFVDAVADWGRDGTAPAVDALPGRPVPGRCTVYRPPIGPLLPVYVADRYEGVRAVPFVDCDSAEIERYVDANVAAVAEIVSRVHPDVALANHLVMGPLILARALAGTGVPYAVKVHGSALEYTVARAPERFGKAAHEGCAAARGILVGSSHIARRLVEVLGDPALSERIRLGPPGVDTAIFTPLAPQDAGAALRRLAAELRAAAPERAAVASTFARDERAIAAALERIAPGELVTFVGKLIVSKGVDLLLAAWPLVLQGRPGATLALVGFGAYEPALRRLCDRLAAGDLAGAKAIARAGRALERDDGAAGAPSDRLRHLLAFLEAVDEDAYARAARGLRDRVVFVGRLEHRELAPLLAASEALVVPSTFPEAFGMVAVEAAACGAVPLSAAHSGLAEVTAELAAEVPAASVPQLSFTIDDGAVEAIARRVLDVLQSPLDARTMLRRQLADAVARRWSWQGVAAGVIAAARGDLEALPPPPGRIECAGT